MNHWWWLMEYYGWLMVNNCWAVDNNGRLMVNYWRSMQHDGCTMNYNVRAMIDFRRRVIYDWWAMHYDLVFSLPLSLLCMLWVYLCYILSSNFRTFYTRKRCFGTSSKLMPFAPLSQCVVMLKSLFPAFKVYLFFS